MSVSGFSFGFGFAVSFYLSIHPPVCSFCLPILSVRLSIAAVFTSVCLHACLSVRLSVCVSACFSACPFVFISFCLPVRPPDCPSICMHQMSLSPSSLSVCLLYARLSLPPLSLRLSVCLFPCLCFTYLQPTIMFSRVLSVMVCLLAGAAAFMTPSVTVRTVSRPTNSLSMVSENNVLPIKAGM